MRIPGCFCFPFPCFANPCQARQFPSGVRRFFERHDMKQLTVINVPMELVSRKPEMNVRLVDTGTHIVFGGLFRSPSWAIQEAEAEFLEPGRSNGTVVKRQQRIEHLFSIPVGKTKEWLPDDDAMDNIDTQAITSLGLGEVRWFGALLSETEPLHAGYRLPSGKWVVGDGKWSWRDALDHLLDAASVSKDDPAFRDAQRQASFEYGSRVLNSLRMLRRGEVYGVVAYAFSKSGKYLSDLDYLSFGCIGKDQALATLSDAINEIIAQLE
jgi:hypothetical protein